MTPDTVMTRFFRLLPEATEQDLLDMRSILSTLIRSKKTADESTIVKQELDLQPTSDRN